ncbi:RTA1 domain-containing protein [Aspergillus novofumigatus IBT 16806]|uniref:RTA1 like protein n=1 Tax=Aspergillus novofumigatus (strain IBT 16806) TaxID=1392255 RepID=A0A2I1BSK6_ASPN1|nr:RTA1 like protein [Aspergillus novofumigatus IBT 16806]PKX88373.1 RTA1 like protein [Aspergillus novofumigatus IBT 16806]
MAGDDKNDFKLYRYTPSTTAAARYLKRARAWYFIAFVIGASVIQIIGYVCRVLAHSHKDSVPIYSVQTILILLAPPLYAASIYMMLGRLVAFLRAEKLSIVLVRWMTEIFVTRDVTAFIMQAAGGGIMASGTVSSYNLGEHITVTGLCVQLVFFSFFISTCALFHYRIRKYPTHEMWETVLVGLYASSILILVRSIFRLIKCMQGNDRYFISHEVFMYVFSSTLAFLAMEQGRGNEFPGFPSCIA